MIQFDRQCNPHRRLLLKAGLFAWVFSPFIGFSLTKLSGHIGYLQIVARAIGLGDAAFKQLATKIVAELSAVQAEYVIGHAADLLFRASITSTEQAHAVVMAAVQNDLHLGHTLNVRGVRFSATELGLLLSTITSSGARE